MSRLKSALVAGLVIFAIGGTLISPALAQNVPLNGQRITSTALGSDMTSGLGSNAGSTGSTASGLGSNAGSAGGSSGNSCSLTVSLLSFDISGFINCLVSDLLQAVINLIKDMIAVLIAALLWLAGQFVNFAIGLNLLLTAGGCDTLACQGWKYSLGLTDYLFVIGIIIISFGVILRSGFGEKLLPRFIITAILIGFSYYIAIYLIAASTAVTSGFITQSGATNYVTALNTLSSTFSNVQTSGISLGSTLSATALGFASIFFEVIFGLVAFVTLMAVGVMFLYRYVALAILLILLPFAMFLGIFPIKLSGVAAWAGWVEQFTRWIIFGPVMGFFMWIAFALANTYKIPPLAGADVLVAQLGNMIVEVGLLLGGLIAANKLGIRGAGAFTKFAKDVVPIAVGTAAVGGAAYGASRFLVGGGEKGGTNRGGQLSNFLAKLPVVGTVASSYVAQKTKAGVDTRVTAVSSRLKDLSDDAVYSQAALSNSMEHHAVTATKFNELARRNLLDRFKKEHPKLFEMMKGRARTTGVYQDILANRPDQAKDFGKTIEEAMRGADASKISEDALRNKEVRENMTDEHVKTLATKGTPKQRAAFSEGVISDRVSSLNIKKLDELNDALKKFDKDIKTATQANNKTYANQLTGEREAFEKQINDITANLSRAEKKTLAHHKIISDNLLWQKDKEK